MAVHLPLHSNEKAQHAAPASRKRKTLVRALVAFAIVSFVLKLFTVVQHPQIPESWSSLRASGSEEEEDVAAPSEHKTAAAAVSTTGSTSSASADSLTQAAFADLYEAVDYGAPFDGEKLSSLCDNIKWRKDVVLQLDGTNGGFSNIRAMILDFVFLAIHSGTPIVLPQIIHRNDKDISDIINPNAALLPFSHFFDQAYFLAKLDKHCPQMKIHLSAKEAPTTYTLPGLYHPGEVKIYRGPKGEDLAARIHELHNTIESSAGYDSTSVGLLHVYKTFFNYDLYPMERERKALGMLLRVRRDARRLAGIAIWNMAKRNISSQYAEKYATLTPGPDAQLVKPARAPASPDPSTTMHANLFFGAHMRTEVDALKIGWLGLYGGFDAQTDAFIGLARTSGLATMYVASGWPMDIDRLVVKAKKSAGITVYSKRDLLHPTELASLDWDQQAMIDYEILSRASFFAGPSMSSFTWNIATRRHLYNMGQSRRRENPEMVQEEEADVSWDDGLSRIICPQNNTAPVDLQYMALRRMFP